MRIAVVGLGFMGTTHARAWQKIPGAQLAAIVLPPTEDATVPIGNLPGHAEPLDLSGIPVRPQLQDVLNDPAIDAVDLCLPTDLHAQAAVDALEAGKHVLVEKPMALNGEDCDRMMAAARSAGRLLMVGHVIRFWGAYLPLIEALRSGSLGRLRSLDLRRQCAAPAWGGWLSDPKRSGGGVFDLLIHDVDLCIDLLGAPQAVAATGDADYLAANLYYGDTTSVTICGGWHDAPAYPFSMGYTARFDEGTVEFSTDGKPARLYRSNGEVEQASGGAVDAFEAELSYFAECVRSGHKAERCRMEDSALAVRLTRKLAEARAERGKVIECGEL